MKILKHNCYAIGTIFTCIFDDQEITINAVCFPDSYEKKNYDDFFSDVKFTILNKELDENNFVKNYSLDSYRKIQKFLFDYYGEKIIPEYDFLRYHYTGSIDENAYADYIVDYNIKDYGRIIHTFKDKKGEEISLRSSHKKNKYVKKDENNEILRDSNGLAIYLSDQEAIEKNLSIYDTTIIAFNENQISVGMASDEFGADGIWVNKDYQRRGIGIKLLKHFRDQFSKDRKIGQMTVDGEKMVSAYFQKYINK